MLRGAGSRSLTRIGEPHLGDATTTSEWWGVFINVGIYSKRFACRESCYVNRQVSSYSWNIYIYSYIYMYPHIYNNEEFSEFITWLVQFSAWMLNVQPGMGSVSLQACYQWYLPSHLLSLVSIVTSGKSAPWCVPCGVLGNSCGDSLPGNDIGY